MGKPSEVKDHNVRVHVPQAAPASTIRSVSTIDRASQLGICDAARARATRSAAHPSATGNVTFLAAASLWPCARLGAMRLKKCFEHREGAIWKEVTVQHHHDIGAVPLQDNMEPDPVHRDSVAEGRRYPMIVKAIRCLVRSVTRQRNQDEPDAKDLGQLSQTCRVPTVVGRLRVLVMHRHQFHGLQAELAPEADLIYKVHRAGYEGKCNQPLRRVHLLHALHLSMSFHVTRA
mmetsp:Transcript_27064/g.71335  ORF Transcript_27064/g.71335 Transcript_27064/m.71335 type:complete len:232 (+) Transcript_27064:2710-3405(+)